MPQRIEIPTRRDEYYLTSDHTIAVRGTGRGFNRRFGIGAMPADMSGRQVTGGPLVPGPWAFAFGLCSVIDNHGGSAREAAEKRAAGTEHVVDFGDELVIDGHAYTVERIPWSSEHVKLVLVADAFLDAAAKLCTGEGMRPAREHARRATR